MKIDPFFPYIFSSYVTAGVVFGALAIFSIVAYLKLPKGKNGSKKK